MLILEKTLAVHLLLLLVNEDGADKIELEEAYVESLAGSFLDNTYFKIGRAFWNIGSLNLNMPTQMILLIGHYLTEYFLIKHIMMMVSETSYLLPGKNINEIGFGIFR